MPPIGAPRQQPGAIGYAAGVEVGPLSEFSLTPTPGTLVLATCDSQVEGRHFLRSRIAPEHLGRRLAAVNLSDIAAMGGEPRWALVSLALPPETEVEFLEALYSGLVAELRRFGAAVVGGNVTGSGELLLDLTLLGEVRPEELLRRSGARPGDAILVTGTLGESAAGRALLDAGMDISAAPGAVQRHLTPEPRVEAGRALARSRLATAAIDVSDGFSQDLGRSRTARAQPPPRSRWIRSRSRSPAERTTS
jgi:thiamine-monophosphate kinase